MPELFESMIEPLKSSAGVKSVFGDAVSAQGKTIIPVARIAWGFGGGSGKRAGKDQPDEGQGGGGGVVSAPLGVVEVTESQTRFIPLHENRKLLLCGLIGFSIGLFWASRRKRS